MFKYECTVRSGEYNLTKILDNSLKDIKEEIERFSTSEMNEDLQDYISQNGLHFSVLNNKNKIVYEISK